MKQTVYIGADHAGFDLKEIIKEHLHDAGYHVEDMGAYRLDPTDDYPRYAQAVAAAVTEHADSVGILFCGNAEGVCIAANKFDGIRAGIGYAIEAAETTRADDNANIICIPGRVETKDDPIKIAEAFLTTPFSQAPRHVRRLGQLHAIEHEDIRLTTIIPALLVEHETTFRKKIHHQGLRQLAPLWQIDIMDGSFVDQTSWADPRVIKTMDPLPNFELHLMIEDPLPVITAFHKTLPSVTCAIIHAEIQTPLRPLIRAIKDLDLEVGLALNPETKIKKHLDLIEQCNVLLLMGVHPGASAQSFLGKRILRKIKRARKLAPHVRIAIDGGVNLESARSMVNAGAHHLCTSSALWKAEDPIEAYRRLQHL
jgi:ribose 5-phosphate isomerase B